MIAAGFPLAVAGNVTRLLVIIIVSEAFGQKTGQWVHDNSFFSLLPYIPPIVGIIVIGHLLREQNPEDPVQPPMSGSSKSADDDNSSQTGTGSFQTAEPVR